MTVPLAAPAPARAGPSRLRPPGWLLSLLGWLGVALLMAGQNWVSHLARHATRAAEPADPSFSLYLWAALTDWGAWAVLSPLILLAARRLSVRRLGWARALAVHVPLAALFASLQVAGHLLIDIPVEAGWMGHPFAPLEHGAVLLVRYLPGNASIYLVMVGLVHAVDYYRASRQGLLRASRLEARLAQARLQLLQVQLQPHFLFNTLNAISALMHRDVEAADRMLVRLSELLRLSLESVGTQQVSLRRELEFLAPYLDIERCRFGKRLTVALDAPPEVLGAQVPALLLQPLVENAIRHGVAARAAGGRVEVRARREGERLSLHVVDDGPGLPAGADAPSRLGVGLQNTRDRLEGLYGGSHAFSFGRAAGGGFEVRVDLPYRTGEARA